MVRSPSTRPRDDATLLDALGSIGVGTWWWDRTSGAVRWDEALERLFGLPPGGFPGTFEAWVQRLHPDDRPRVLESVERGIEGGHHFRFDHRCVWPDGTDHWIEGRGSPTFDTTGRVIGAHGIALGIEERRAAEEERERLLEHERVARAHAEEVSERLSNVQRATAILASATTIDDVARILLDESMRVTAASAGFFSVRDTNDALTVQASRRTFEAPPVVELDCRMTDRTPLAEAVRTGESVFVTGRAEWAQRYPECSDLSESLVALPLPVDGSARAVLSLLFPADRTIETGQRDYLATLADLGASAVARAEAVRTEREAANRVARMQQLSEQALLRLPLTESLEAVPSTIAKIVGCDVVRVLLLTDDGRFLEEKAQHGLGSDAELVRIPRGKGLAGRIVEAGRPMSFPDISNLDAFNPRFATLVRSAAGVPLLTDDEVLGVLDVGSYQHRSFGQSEISLLELAAERLAAALVRSRAYEVERRERERSEYLNRIGDILIRPTSVRETTDAIAEAAVPRLADWAVVVVLEDDEDPHISSFGLPAIRAVLDRAEASGLQYRTDLAIGVPATLRTGEERLFPEIDPDTLVRLSGDPAMGRLADELALRSMIIVPLHGHDGVVGAIQLARQVPGPAYGQSDLALVRDVADRVGITLESARTHERQREIASTLQRSLLPAGIPDVTGVDIAARYWPADEASDVGGDFFDVFSLGDDRWGVLIGDVSGKGVGAAALTGIARHTARAAAHHGLPPTMTLEWIHDAFLADQLPNQEYCTALFGVLDHRESQLTFTFGAGGHPLPILRPGRSGSAHLVGSNGTALGLVSSPSVREHSISLASGDWLLLYTDGITDIPHPRPMMDDELLALVEDATNTRDAERTIDNIETALRQRNGPRWRHDDTVLLVIRRH